MHLLIRERHGLEDAAQAEDLGQPPADLVVLSFSDSDLGAFAAAWRGARQTLPTLRLANLRRLSHPASVDLYAEKTLSGARGILIRLLGGVDYWRYGLDEVIALAGRRNIALAVVPGDGRDDPRLEAYSTVPHATLRRLKTLCDTGGEAAALAALAEMAEAAGLDIKPPREAAALAGHGFYRPEVGVACPVLSLLPEPSAKRALLVFYRSFLTAADTAPVDALFEGLEKAGFETLAVFVPSLKAPETAPWLARWVGWLNPDVIINATAFSARGEGHNTSPFDHCDAPVLQVALAGSDRKSWRDADRGLSPTDLAMHVVLPEVDGRLFGGVVSFKEASAPDTALLFARLSHSPEPDRVAMVVEKALRWAQLRQTPRDKRRLALILSTYPGRDDQIAHAVGLDAPASTVSALNMLRAEGYGIDSIPLDGAGLMAAVMATTMPWPLANYESHFASLPPELRAEITACWGAPGDDPCVRNGAFRFAAIRAGSATVALQPERGRARDRAGEYHDTRRPPCHGYIAFYFWLRQALQVDAVIHMGAHGTLEWLPGKSVALSSRCWPEVLVGATPVIYPFVVNDPGEAAAAKRRLSALTIGHMTPPLAQAGVPAGLGAIERLLDEYSTADGLDPRRRSQLMASILEAAREAGLDADARLEAGMEPQEAMTRLDAFVCDIKATQFLDGLHVFGEVPPPVATSRAERPMPYEACALAERAALLAALDGRAVAPGPAGSPWRGRLDVMPTGRNLFSVDPRGVPSQSAWDQGQKLCDALITRHLQEQGDYPRSVMVDLWGSATMRTSGEDFAMALALVGVKPIWDLESGRVSGFEILPLAQLGRPRIDVTLRMSGLFRDVFPGLPALFDQAVTALAVREEPEGENPFNAAPGARVFGPAPGAYGAGMGEHLTDLSPSGAELAGAAWLAASSHAYGRTGEGVAALEDIRRRTAMTDAFVHTQDLPETDLLVSPDYAAHIAGFAAAARSLGGPAPLLYHADTTRPDDTRVHGLNEEIARVVRSRAANPEWIAGQMRHGYRGAAEMASTLDQMAAFAHLAHAVGSHHFDLYFDATLGNDAVCDFLENANPAALAAMRQRFADLTGQGYWQTRRNSVGMRLGHTREAAE